MGAQVPHWYQIASQPLEYVNIYFFPMALMNWVSPEVSILLLQRFAAEHPLAQRNIHLPGSLLHEFTQVFCAAANEFEARRLGWELHLQASLVHCLVTLARWERGLRSSPKPVARRVYWDRLERVLQHLRERHAEPVYVHDLALLAGMSESSLNAMFQATLGMTWVKYLQAFRVQRSLALLAQPGETIASVAYSVGFESISHFNTTFRSLMGMSPKELLKKQSNFS
jgi:AraC-like DNA-binding protein